MGARWITGDVFDGLAQLEPGSVDLVLTSPPFLALRSYLPADDPNKDWEIGSEATPAEFLDVLLRWTAECSRVLAPHGSLCVELGDTYAGSGGAGGDYNAGGLRQGQNGFTGSAHRSRHEQSRQWSGGEGWPLPKSLVCVPQLYEIALAYGLNPLTGEPSPAGRWRVRNQVAWVRPNPPVGALGDKYRPATSYMTVACRAADRWFDLDAVRREPKPHTVKYPRDADHYRNDGYAVEERGDSGRIGSNGGHPAGAPPLDWWEISPTPYSGAHYAVWPAELCRIPIDSMCPRRVCSTCGTPSRREVDRERHVNGDRPDRRQAGQGRDGGYFESYGSGTFTTSTTTGWSTCGCEGADGLRLDGWHTGNGWRPGVVLDPFAGSGTTLAVATGMSRDAIGIDLDPRNEDLARERVGMFLETTSSNKDGETLGHKETL